MSVVSLRLADEVRSLVLGVGPPAGPGFRSDLIVQTLDVSPPAVREVVTSRVGVDGVLDQTQFFGARAVAIEATLFDHPAALMDQLSPFLAPSARPYLYVIDDEWGAERRLSLRPANFTSPQDNNTHWMRKVQLQWQCPSGVWELGEAVNFTVAGLGSTPTGRTYPFSPPRTYPPTGATGQLTITNPGGVPCHQRVRLYGPCNGPRYTNRDTGETLIFLESLQIPAGEYVEIDTEARTAYYLSDPSASRLSYLDFANSTWWRLRPGSNRVQYHPTSAVDVGCALQGLFRPKWL